MSEEMAVYGGWKFCGNCGIRVDGECTLPRAEMEHCLITPGRPYWRKLVTDRERLEEFLKVGRVMAQCTQGPEDFVNHPNHYTQHPREVIDIIKDQLVAAYGLDGYRAYCWGNEIKYRMRAGLKGDAAEDIGKAMKYKEFREGVNEN